MSYFETDLSSGLLRMAARSLKAPMKSMVRVLSLTSSLRLWRHIFWEWPKLWPGPYGGEEPESSHEIHGESVVVDFLPEIVTSYILRLNWAPDWPGWRRVAWKHPWSPRWVCCRWHDWTCDVTYFETDLSSSLVRMAARSLKALMKSMVIVFLLTSFLSLGRHIFSDWPELRPCPDGGKEPERSHEVHGESVFVDILPELVTSYIFRLTWAPALSDGGKEPESAHEVHGESVVVDIMPELMTSYFETDLSSGLVRMAASSLKAPMKSMVSVLSLTSSQVA